MNAISYKCPNCGNNVLCDRQHIAQFCSQCGAPLKIPETAFDHEKFVLEHEEKVRQTKAKEDRKIGMAAVWLMIGLIAFCTIMYFIASGAKNQKYTKADKQIEIVQQLITAGDYDRALVEAESIRIAKDGLWDPDYTHYENARKDLIKLIKEKQKE